MLLLPTRPHITFPMSVPIRAAVQCVLLLRRSPNPADRTENLSPLSPSRRRVAAARATASLQLPCPARRRDVHMHVRRRASVHGPSIRGLHSSFRCAVSVTVLGAGLAARAPVRKPDRAGQGSGMGRPARNGRIGWLFLLSQIPCSKDSSISAGNRSLRLL